ncbi:hypothetical protein FXO38_07940 [Capsicum annuum]|nr:hypothetical protein FXO38_07940 [Capsicum annuum]
MELLALFQGLITVFQHNLYPVEINTNFELVIHWLTHENLIYNPIIDKYRSMIRRLGNPPVYHCYMEQNRVEDTLAKEGAKQNQFADCSFFYAPPFVSHDTWADNIGFFYQRNILTPMDPSGQRPTTFKLELDYAQTLCVALT